MNSVVRPLATIYTGSTHPESFLVSYRRMSLACVQTPPPLTDVSLPIFSEGRRASVLRLVYSLPLACVAGVEKGRSREEGKKAGGLGTFPLLSSSVAGGWGGGGWSASKLSMAGQSSSDSLLAGLGGGALGPS